MATFKQVINAVMRSEKVADLSVRQFAVLYHIDRTGKRRPERFTSNVAKALGLNKSAVTRACDALEKGSGYLRRLKVPEDARKTEIQITDAGKALLAWIATGGQGEAP